MTTGLLPHRPPVDEPERGTRVLELGSGDAAAVCQLLGTETATDVLATLDEEPATASGVAEAVDMSLQSVDYHLRQLREAGLVRVVGTWLSSRGAEMSVYAPSDERLVITAEGPDSPSLAEDGAADESAVAEDGATDGSAVAGRGD